MRKNDANPLHRIEGKQNGVELKKKLLDIFKNVLNLQRRKFWFVRVKMDSRTKYSDGVGYRPNAAETKSFARFPVRNVSFWSGSRGRRISKLA